MEAFCYGSVLLWKMTNSIGRLGRDPRSVAQRKVLVPRPRRDVKDILPLWKRTSPMEVYCYKVYIEVEHGDLLRKQPQRKNVLKYHKFKRKYINYLKALDGELIDKSSTTYSKKLIQFIVKNLKRGPSCSSQEQWSSNKWVEMNLMNCIENFVKKLMSLKWFVKKLGQKTSKLC